MMVVEVNFIDFCSPVLCDVCFKIVYFQKQSDVGGIGNLACFRNECNYTQKWFYTFDIITAVRLSANDSFL